MIITSVFGSGASEHDRSGIKNAPTPTRRIVFLSEAKDLLFPETIVSASRIRDFPQQRRTLRSRRRRYVAGPPMPGLVREQGEGHGFFGLGWNSELVRETKADPERGDL